ncbi:helix-turn-helix domain-containing protein [Fulvivirgaceae bacterium PWU4]|uniref:Helix-turn-helix domain-containing protein n=1 Tax=Chryseosolibacter histidini TaxID=2782349 RepID=A0AAP2GRD2_9BACT|nr:AraC family transcriptional regulator [Chryseosolibacter histidini]MBT1701048.1 helix-turn-helix domain-containing protein [Chryseosolibacter histidini]
MDFNIDTLRFPLSYPDDTNTGLMHHCHGITKNDGAVSELPVTDFVGLVFNLQEDIRYYIDNSNPGTLPKRQYNLVYIPNATIKLASEKGKYSIFCIQFTAHYLKKIKDHFPILTDFLKRAEAQPSAVLGDPRPIAPDLWHEIHLILIDKERTEEHHKLLLGPKYVTISMHSLTYLGSFVHRDKTEIEKIREGYFQKMLLSDPRPMPPKAWTKIQMILGYKEIQGEGHKVLLGSQYITASMDSLRHSGAVGNLTSIDIEKIRNAHDYIQKNFKFTCRISDIADIVKLNPKHLKNGFKIVYEKTVHKFLVDERMSRSIVLFRDTNMSIKEIAVAVGYKNARIFARVFKKHFGYPPGKLPKKDGERQKKIRFP